LASITSSSFVLLRASRLAATSRPSQLTQPDPSNVDITQRSADGHHMKEALGKNTVDGQRPVTWASRDGCIDSIKEPSISSSWATTVCGKADDESTLQDFDTCHPTQSEDTIPSVPPPSPALYDRKHEGTSSQLSPRATNVVT